MTNQQMHDNLAKALREVGYEESGIEDVIKLFFEEINAGIFGSLMSALGSEGGVKLNERLKNAKSHDETDRMITELCEEYGVDLESIKKKVAASAVPSAWRALESKMSIEQWKKFVDVLEWEEV